MVNNNISNKKLQNTNPNLYLSFLCLLEQRTRDFAKSLADSNPKFFLGGQIGGQRPMNYKIPNQSSCTSLDGTPCQTKLPFQANVVYVL